MALDNASGYVAAGTLQDLEDASLPMFEVSRVELQFSIAANFVAARVANDVLILALSTGRIMRIDLNRSADIEDLDLPKKPSETGVIRRMFLDPTASHCIFATTLADNYYLHTQSRQPKLLSRLRGVPIESVSWNPSEPTASTREILVGASDGNMYETFIEPSTEFYRREEKYCKQVYKAEGPITGIWTDTIPAKPDTRRVVIATPLKLSHFVGKAGRSGDGPVFLRFFEAEEPAVYEIGEGSRSKGALAISPDISRASPLDPAGAKRAYAWLSSQGVLHGKLSTSPATGALGSKLFAESKMLPRSQIPQASNATGRRRSGEEPISSMLMTQWHIVLQVGPRVVAINRLDNSVVFEQAVLNEGQTALGLVEDQKKNTYWLFTAQEILEIRVTDEDRDIWKIMLKAHQFETALQYAKNSSQRDAIATASGDHLVSSGKLLEAAGVYGKSSKPFEEVALTFIDRNDQDALRKYLLTKLSALKKSSVMQRVMLASWLVEVFMAKLNVLDDTINTRAELSANTNTSDTQAQLSAVRREFGEFVGRYKGDLDRRTTYDVISSHGREEELLRFATVINDYIYVLSYWVQRHRWAEAMAELKKQTDLEAYYRYSTVLMMHLPVEFVEVLMRQSGLDARRIVPALLSYNETAKVPLNQNQAVRYLLFEINQRQSVDAAVHNILISIYASHPSRDESALLSYLESQGQGGEHDYDADFALRLCIQHKRVQSCVYIYSSMSQYVQAVDLALKHEEIELASNVADRAENDGALRKKLWLAVAKRVISQTSSIKAAIDFLKRCELLRIEDLIPFFPDFVVIDDFKEEICGALEEYSRHIDSLKREMDESAATASHIKADMASLDQRYAIVEPGEKCYACRYPLLSRQFYVFPCQHAFHSDCLGRRVVEQAGAGKSRRIRELQSEVGRGGAVGKGKERAIAELDALIASACVLCSEMAVKRIDEPFVLPTDDPSEWVL